VAEELHDRVKDGLVDLGRCQPRQHCQWIDASQKVREPGRGGHAQEREDALQPSKCRIKKDEPIGYLFVPNINSE
jgi:hypothetical protein